MRNIYNMMSHLGALIFAIVLLPLLVIYDNTGWLLLSSVCAYYDKCLRKMMGKK